MRWVLLVALAGLGLEQLLESAKLSEHPSVRGFDRDPGEYPDRLPIAVGTDAGNPGTLHGPSIYSELAAMQEAGITPRELLVMATRNGARAMGRSDIGTLQVGNVADLVADLVVVSENPLEDVRALRSLTHVMRAGRIAPIESFAREN